LSIHILTEKENLLFLFGSLFGATATAFSAAFLEQADLFQGITNHAFATTIKVFKHKKISPRFLIHY
jgi:hypothetical protein